MARKSKNWSNQKNAFGWLKESATHGAGNAVAELTTMAIVAGVIAGAKGGWKFAQNVKKRRQDKAAGGGALGTSRSLL